MKIFKNLYIAIFCFILLNTLLIFKVYVKQVKKADTIRLHVVANSNSIEDQITKFKVENNLENFIKTLDSSKSKTEFISSLNENFTKLLNISNSTLVTENKNYTSKLNIGSIAYDEKENQTVTMEKGVYESVQVILGEGKGKNIWTLIFPKEEDIENLKNLETILPGISNIFSKC